MILMLLKHKFKEEDTSLVNLSHVSYKWCLVQAAILFEVFHIHFYFNPKSFLCQFSQDPSRNAAVSLAPELPHAPSVVFCPSSEFNFYSKTYFINKYDGKVDKIFNVRLKIFTNGELSKPTSIWLSEVREVVMVVEE